MTVYKVSVYNNKVSIRDSVMEFEMDYPRPVWEYQAETQQEAEECRQVCEAGIKQGWHPRQKDCWKKLHQELLTLDTK